MAASTGFVITAGVLTLTEDLVTDRWENPKALKVGVATVLAAYVSAGLDKALPGLGTGLAVILVLTVALKSGPAIFDKILSEG
jgi:hypothetical protein